MLQNLSGTLFPMILIFSEMKHPKGQQAFIEVPTDVDSKPGHDIMLRCAIRETIGSVEWLKNRKTLGGMRTLPRYSRYAIEGDKQKGEYHLKIKDSKLEDDGTYTCRAVGGPDDFKPPIEADARLVIYVASKEIKVHGHGQSTHDGGTILVPPIGNILLTCVAMDIHPTPSIQWYKGGTKVSNDSEMLVEETEGTRLIVAKLSLLFEMQFNQTPDTYQCRINHLSLPESGKTIDVKLKVLDKNIGSSYFINFSTPERHAQEGSEIKLEVHFRADRSLKQFGWVLEAIHKQEAQNLLVIECGDTGLKSGKNGTLGEVITGNNHCIMGNSSLTIHETTTGFIGDIIFVVVSDMDYSFKAMSVTVHSKPMMYYVLAVILGIFFLSLPFICYRLIKYLMRTRRGINFRKKWLRQRSSQLSRNYSEKAHRTHEPNSDRAHRTYEPNSDKARRTYEPMSQKTTSEVPQRLFSKKSEDWTSITRSTSNQRQSFLSADQDFLKPKKNNSDLKISVEHFSL